MKNFDTERQKRVDQDRSFQINGQTFTHKPAVAPEALTEWSAMVGGEYVERDADGKAVLSESTPARDRDGHLIIRGGRLVPLEVDGKSGEMVLQGGEIQMLPGQPISNLTEEKALEIYEHTILAFLEPGQEEQWQSARSPQSANPINLNDLTELITWLFEETSGRPTGPSSSSSGSTAGDANGQPETPLTPVLPLPAAAPPASTT